MSPNSTGPPSSDTLTNKTINADDTGNNITNIEDANIKAAAAIDATKNGGIIHYYAHIHADKKSEAGKLSEEHYLKVTPVKSEILGSKIVRPVGPRYYQTVVDVRITK